MLSLCACGGGAAESSTPEEIEESSSTEEIVESESSLSEKNETESSESESSEEESAAEESDEPAAETAEMEEGDTGDGPAELNAGLVSFTLPEGYSYEAYTFFIDEDDPMSGTVQLDITETGAYDTLVKVYASTQHMYDGQMVSSSESAVQSVIKLANLDTYEEGSYTIGDDATYGELTYTPVELTTEWSQQTCFVAYAENGSSYGGGLLINVIVDLTKLDADDPLVTEILESLAVVTK